jgi:hypothetical protein
MSAELPEPWTWDPNSPDTAVMRGVEVTFDAAADAFDICADSCGLACNGSATALVPRAVTDAVYERSRKRDELVKAKAAMVDVRLRREPNPKRRMGGLINDLDADGAGWLVLASSGETLLELKMLPDESAREAADRFAAAGEGPGPERALSMLLAGIEAAR